MPPCARSPRMRHCLIVVPIALLLGCGLPRPMTVPMATIREPAHCASTPTTLIVMLPGAASTPDEFIREGFVRALRERRIAADVTIVDAHPGYYRARTIIDRLRTDIVEPARARGYRQIWLVGISLGGFGSLIYSRERPEGISGIVAIAPYLGEGLVAQEVTAQGGLSAWRSQPADGEPIDAPLWRWLQGYAQAGVMRPPLYLGYGRADRFATTNAVLGAVLPPDHVFATDGGHDWPPWRALWQRMLDAMPLPRDASCSVTP
jgi:pimeloyl-ACP methyl ester carboxylesterase